MAARELPAAAQVRTAFDAVAPDYASSGTFFSQIARQLMDRARLAPGMVVLDVGCGTGQFTIPAARAVGPAGRVSGLDLSGQMLNRAEACRAAYGLDNVTLTRGDAHEPPYLSGSFDRVFASMVMFLLADPARAVRAWYELLHPGGTLAFSWNVAEDPRWQPVIAAVDAHVPGGSGFAALLHHPPFHSIAEVEGMLAAASFTDIATTAETIESRYTGPRHWWASSWSQAPRIAWQKMAEDARLSARTGSFRLLDRLRSADGTLTRQSLIGFTVARRRA